jgi:hypothetical protein
MDDVDLVTANRDMNGERMDELVVESTDTDRVRRNERGELESIQLHTAELIDASIAPEDLKIAIHG